MLSQLHRLKLQWFKSALEQQRNDDEGDGASFVVWTLGISALALATAVLAPYFFVFNGDLSTDSEKWADFGSYVGGLAGPVLAVVSLLAFLITIRQQAYLAAVADRRAREEEHRRAINGYLDDLQRLESRPLSHDHSLADLFSGAIDASSVTDQLRLQQLLRVYGETLFRYAEMVAMHRANNRPLWDVTYYKNRGMWAFRQLDQLTGYLNPFVLEAIRNHLEDSWPQAEE